MTDATASSLPRVGRIKKPSVPLPRPQPFGGSVFISDCITPLCGETVLSLLLKRMARDDLEG